MVITRFGQSSYLDSVAAGQKKSADVIANSGINPDPGFDWGGFFKGLLGPRAGVMGPKVNDLSGKPAGVDLKTVAVVGGVIVLVVVIAKRKK